MNIIALYPGTFDPITYGHLDIIERAAKLFDEIIIGVATSSRKAPYFPMNQRLRLIHQAIKSLHNVRVIEMTGLLVEFAKKEKASVIVRGLRGGTDFDYESQLAGMNRILAPDIETVFLAASEKYRHISGTFVREIMDLGGDIGRFVPEN